MIRTQIEESVRVWESTAKSPKGEGRFWNVQRHRGVDGNEMELEGRRAGGLSDGAPPGETELIADCENLSLFCSQSSHSSFQAGEGPRSPGFRPDDGAEARGARGQAVTSLWLKAKGLD